MLIATQVPPQPTISNPIGRSFPLGDYHCAD
jgi:hypothetical protein